MKNLNNGNARCSAIDPRKVVQAAQRAVREALWRHRVLGETIVVAEGDKIVHLTGEEIQVTKPES